MPPPPFHDAPAYHGKSMPKKFLDEMPQRKQQEANYENFVSQNKHKGQPKEFIAPSLSSITKKQNDQRVHKKTVYDLTGKSDWRTSTHGEHMAGPIDHVSKNKAAHSNKQQTLNPSLTHYVERGHTDEVPQGKDLHSHPPMEDDYFIEK